MKRKAVIVGTLLIAFIVLTVLTPMPAIASYPGLGRSMTIGITNLPENAVFADILIKINENDPNFAAVNESNLALFGLGSQAGIVGFNNNGFMSFTFHYRNAAAEIRAAEIRRVDGTLRGHYVRFGHGEREGFRGQFPDLLENYPDMKIALLDLYGNVISVSAEFSLPRPRRGVDITGTWAFEEVSYDYETGVITVNLGVVRYNYLGRILRPVLQRSPVLVLSAIALVSVIMELVVGFCFGFRRKELLPIVCANLATLSAIAAFIAWLFLSGYDGNAFPLFFRAALLLAITYAIKYIIYRKNPITKDISTRKIKQCVITGNTLSFAYLVAVFMVCMMP